MTITVRQQLDTSTTTGTSMTLTLGAGTVTTDFLVLVQANDFYTLADLGTPTGTAASTWSLRTSYDGGANTHHGKIWTAPVTTAGAQTIIANGGFSKALRRTTRRRPTTAHPLRRTSRRR